MLFEAIRDFINRILASLLEPLLNWIIALSYIKRLLFVLLVLFLIGMVYFYKTVYTVVANSKQYYSILTSNNSSIPITSENRVALKNLINNTTNTLLQSEFPKWKIDGGFYNPWTESDIIVSTKCNDITYRDQFNLCAYSSKAFISQCHCWSQFDNEGFCNYPATSWIMMGFNNFKTKPSDSLIDFLITSQNEDGWWSIFPSSSQKDASTLATALTILALNNCKKNVNNKDKLIKVNAVINKGLRWLENSIENNGDIVFDFPNADDKNSSSIAIYGIVVHAIVTIDTTEEIVTKIKLKWLDNLDEWVTELKTKDDHIFNIKSVYKSSHTCNVNFGHDNARQDDVNNYALPWFIIASSDCYNKANLIKKAKILSCFTDIIKHGNVLIENASGQPWLISEFLVALRTINGEKII